MIRFRNNENKHPMCCEAQLAWKCLFTPIFFGGRFWSLK